MINKNSNCFLKIHFIIFFYFRVRLCSCTGLFEYTVRVLNLDGCTMGCRSWDDVGTFNIDSTQDVFSYEWTCQSIPRCLSCIGWIGEDTEIITTWKNCVWSVEESKEVIVRRKTQCQTHDELQQTPATQGKGTRTSCARASRRLFVGWGERSHVTQKS